MSVNSVRHTCVNKILIVGLGSIGKRHIEIIRDLFPEITIGLLRHSKCNEDEIKSYGIKFCFSTIEEALAYQPDAAILANPASFHIDVAIPFADAGVHLLIEKPISNNIDGVRKLISLCSKNGLILMTAYNLRFSPSLNQFRDLLHQGKIGIPYAVHVEAGQYLPNWRPNLDYRQTVSAQEYLGGGVLLELSHEIDYTQWIFGSVKWVKATVLRQSHLEIDVEDTAHLQLGMSNGFNDKQLVVTLNIDFIRHNSTRQCHVIGEKGSLLWNGIQGSIEFFSPNSDEWEVLYSNLTERNYTYEQEIRHFISSIESGSSPHVSGDDGLNVVSVIEAVKKSNVEGSLVYLEQHRV